MTKKQRKRIKVTEEVPVIAGKVSFFDSVFYWLWHGTQKEDFLTVRLSLLLFFNLPTFCFS